MIVRLGAAICGVAIILACTSAAMAESGIASIYAYSGEKTANGEFANPGGLTAAHRTLAFGTQVRVTNQRNGRSIIVRINDRGPFVRGRVIDLTPAGARALDFSGLAPVKLEIAHTSRTGIASL
jgi:rare lipoprotein A